MILIYILLEEWYHSCLLVFLKNYSFKKEKNQNIFMKEKEKEWKEWNYFL